MTATLPETPQDLPNAIPSYVSERIKRGRGPMLRRASRIRLFYKFWRGETYWELNQQGQLVNQSTISWRLGGSRPNARVRNTYNFIAAIVEAKVSAATQRVPGYEIVPSTTEPEDAQAAELAQKVALWGYDEWRLRRVTIKLCQHAFVGGEGFVYPYFDTSIGPFVGDVGVGDVRHLVLSANEVYWEPGVDFDDARWYVVERAVPLDVIKALPGYDGPDDLTADAASESQAPSDADKSKLALLREYLERPSAKRPEGRRLVMAGGRQVIPEEIYPCVDHKGQVQDEPVLLRLSYTVETDDRDRGLVERVVDLERTIQDCWNKILEWKNRCLNPRWKAAKGANVQFTGSTPEDPGSGVIYNPVRGPESFMWEQPPAIPRELFTILDTAIQHMRALSADVDVQAEPDLAAQTAVAAVEQSQQRWQSFLGDLAEVHSRLMRRDLYLVQRHYTEPRLVAIQGMFGPDLTQGFLGANLLGQADVRVSPDSLATRTRQAVVQETLLYADRGWISPQAAMATINGGIAEKLSQAWTLDVGRANQVIQAIKRDALDSIRPRPLFPGEDPPPDLLNPGETLQEVPGWMPRPVDNVDIWRQVFETWMKTTEWDSLKDSQRLAGEQIYAALIEIQQRKQAEAAAQQTQMAQALGMSNAAKPQQAAPMPDQRTLASLPDQPQAPPPNATSPVPGQS